MFEVTITPLAEADMQSSVNWWTENRSALEAEQWYDGIIAAIQSLEVLPTRCRIIKPDLVARPVRQLLYGVSSKPTHRILFGVDQTTVTIYRILHTSQRPISADDLSI